MIRKFTTKGKLTLKGFLSFLVILTMVRQFFLGNYGNIFLGILTLILFTIPVIVDRRLDVDIPNALQAVILIFIFSAEILGEIGAFYMRIPIWDTILHTTNGFLMAAIGFCLIDFFNRSEKFSIQMSPLSVTLVAFCFSMTTAVIWEFFEFSMDWFFHTDMQKDWIIHDIYSVTLNPEMKNIPIHIPVESVLINGKDLGVGGYLDIGLIDTMKDMIVNFIGAVVFSFIGFIYLKERGKGSIAPKFIPVVRNSEKDSEKD